MMIDPLNELDEMDEAAKEEQDFWFVEQAANKKLANPHWRPDEIRRRATALSAFIEVCQENQPEGTQPTREELRIIGAAALKFADKTYPKER